MRGLSCAVWLALVVPACGGQVPLGRTEMEITKGSKESGYPAVFALAYDGVGGCTGTCIAPRIGLTAAHCLWDTDTEILTALFGPEEVSPEAVVPVIAAESDPGGGDIAALAFAEACPAVAIANRAELESHVGEPVVMVGYGVTAETAEDYGIKRSGVATLYSLDPAEVGGLEPGDLATSNDPSGTCYGDSGGPTFMTLDGVEVVVGVTSRGSIDENGEGAPCDEGRSIATRADRYATFLDDFMATHDTGVRYPDDGAIGAEPGGEPEVEEPATPAADAADVLSLPDPEDAPLRVSGSGCSTAGSAADGTPLLPPLALAALWLGRRRARS